MLELIFNQVVDQETPENHLEKGDSRIDSHSQSKPADVAGLAVVLPILQLERIQGIRCKWKIEAYGEKVTEKVHLGHILMYYCV